MKTVDKRHAATPVETNALKHAHESSRESAGMAGAALTEADPRWQQVMARDSRADGQFYYAVKTTGIYCRPSCPARRPRPDHVLFFTNTQAAEQAGFVPCRRCHPDQAALSERHAACVTAACRQIEAAVEDDTHGLPDLNALAQQAGLSASYFHRLFKQLMGVTPKAYAQAQRAQRMRNALQDAPTVTDALYNAGYASSGRFYEAADKTLGMMPSRYRAGGADTDIRFTIGRCSLGALLVAESGRGLCAIALGDDPVQLMQELYERFPKARLTDDDFAFAARVAQVIALMDDPTVGLALPLDVRGTAFQQRVWQALQKIPAGETKTYSEIAALIGEPKATRAVASACAANTLAVAIPCHRAMRKDGTFTGYRWGIERKQKLLKKEKA